MIQISKIWYVIVALVVGVFLLFFRQGHIFWNSLPLEKQSLLFEILKPLSAYIYFTLILAIGAIMAAIGYINKNFAQPLRRLIEETNLIHSVNSEHRIKPQGGTYFKTLAASINELAERYSTSLKNIGNEISRAQAEIEREKYILAAFIGELHDGVLICTAEGSIMFYNKRAKELFDTKQPSDSNRDPSHIPPDRSSSRQKETYVGVGRSIFNIIEKNLIVHALDEVATKLHHTESYIASQFVVATKAGKLLRIETIPVLNKKRQLSGFVFTASDITERLQKDNSLDQLMQSLIKKIRASAGGIRSSIETILTYPDMESDQLEKFKAIIHSESLLLGKMAEEAVAAYPGHFLPRWPLVPICTTDLIETTRRKARDSIGISLYIEKSAKDCWVKVESYCATLIILFVLQQLKAQTDLLDFFCKTEKNNTFVNIDISWKGGPILIRTLREWARKPLRIRNEGLDLTLKEVLGHHGASLWSHSYKEHKDKSTLRIIFPACEHNEPEVKKSIAILIEESRPIFYDFDLFHQQGQNPELDNRLLTEIEYTVFDTETTGLAPRGGDEILSIAAVRVINGQILPEERFDQLVDPQRNIPITSIRIHGIQPEMVKGQPTIDKILPSFHDYCENTVLVAHNAAFDMLMLKMKEGTTGIRFVNPVLDTLLLGDILHPAQERNTFEAIAELYGVRIVGRHTALGDALATAEVFSKMIPLLAQAGIHTLGDARSASKKSRYARLKY